MVGHDGVCQGVMRSSAGTQSSAKCKCVEQLKIPATKGKLRPIKAGQQQLQVPDLMPPSSDNPTL